MAAAIDEQVLGLLEMTEFNVEKTANQAVFSNRATSQQQGMRLVFSTAYDTVEDARLTENLLDIYLYGSNKGCMGENGNLLFPTKDSLMRGYRGNRMPEPMIYTSRVDNRVDLIIDMAFVSGGKGLASLGAASEIVLQSLEYPLFLSDKTIFEQCKEELIQAKEDEIWNHSRRAETLFLRHYFPQDYPFSDQDEKNIILESTPESLANAFQNQRSYCTVFYSGDCEINDVLSATEGLRKRLTGNSTDSVIVPQIEKNMALAGDVNINGPSDLTQYIRAYALSRRPETHEEKYAFSIINQILGGEWESRLMSVVRRELDLVYRIYSYHYPEYNMLTVATTHNPSDFMQINKLTCDIIANLVTDQFTEAEFEMFRSRMMESLICSDTPNGLKSCNKPWFRIEQAYNRFMKMSADRSLSEHYIGLARLQYEQVRNMIPQFINPENGQVFTYSRHK